MRQVAARRVRHQIGEIASHGLDHSPSALGFFCPHSSTFTIAAVPHLLSWTAQQYTLCDNSFTDVASQSEPNHLHTFAAFSPVIDNTSHGRNYQPQPPFDIQSLPAVLEAAGHTWRDYSDPNSSYFPEIMALAGST